MICLRVGSAMAWKTSLLIIYIFATNQLQIYTQPINCANLFEKNLPYEIRMFSINLLIDLHFVKMPGDRLFHCVDDDQVSFVLIYPNAIGKIVFAVGVPIG